MVPFIISDDYSFLPFENSTMNYDLFSFRLKMNQFHLTKIQVDPISPNQPKLMRKYSIRYRNSHFVYQGVFDQIQRFMLTGYEDSDLRCHEYRESNLTLT
jgi:hypothetical protein